LTIEESGSVGGIWSGALAAGIRPRLAIVGIPLFNHVSGRGGELADAGTGHLTAIGCLAAFQLGGVARRITIGLRNATCSTPWLLVIRMPQDRGVALAPGCKEFALLALIRIVVE
jgi:hypothetical protein